MNGRFQHFSGAAGWGTSLRRCYFVAAAPGGAWAAKRSSVARLLSRREGAAQADPWQDSPEMYACAGKGRLPGEKFPECALRHANPARSHRNAREWRKSLSWRAFRELFATQGAVSRASAHSGNFSPGSARLQPVLDPLGATATETQRRGLGHRREEFSEGTS